GSSPKGPAMKRTAQPSPISVWEALAEELPGGAAARPELQHAVDAYRHSPNLQTEKSLRRVLIERLHEASRSALCFSGGGIRSATFGLGVLQGLAAHSWQRKTDGSPRLLAEFDYLSTVSGGGYLGAWFSGFAARVKGGTAE